MKFLFKNMLLSLCLLSVLSIAVQAQTKIAHINIPELLASLESWKSAQSQLETHKKMLEDNVSAQQKALETEYNTFQKTIDDFTKRQIEDKQKYFVAKDKELKQSAQKAQQELEQKTIDLTKPIQEKLKAAINAVAQEGNFNYIVDSSAGDLLFLDPAMDVLAKVKAKM